MSKDVLVIREIKSEETAFLKEALYGAIYVPAGKEPLPKEIIELPQLNRYISGFGREDDFCLVAEQDGLVIGAIWIRVFPEADKGYGYVDESTPELSMSVLEEYRNKEIGTQLLNAMIANIEKMPWQQVSLSVDKENYAFGLYKKHGFVVYSETHDSVTMVRKTVKDAC
ncbi:MAG: N-acetyltransferase [Bacteroidetes bacterium]|nr:MAG: N-acetyltransferase [Bacteroidota bacterium]